MKKCCVFTKDDYNYFHKLLERIDAINEEIDDIDCYYNGKIFDAVKLYDCCQVIAEQAEEIINMWEKLG